MSKVKPKYRVMKYDGDDTYSYAVFKSEDVKGLRSPVFYGEATPIVSGCSKHEADYEKKKFEERALKFDKPKLFVPPATKNLLSEVRHLGDLRMKANADPRYQNLAMIAAQNLGASPKDWKHALAELEEQANCIESEAEAEGETIDGEQTITDEVNFVRDIEADEFSKKEITV